MQQLAFCNFIVQIGIFKHFLEQLRLSYPSWLILLAKLEISMLHFS